MTEHTTPELPHPIAADNEASTSLTLCKNAGGFHYVRAQNAKAGCAITVYVDLAELMRNLARFIEAEPVAWMDTTGDFYVQDLRRRSVAGPRTREVFSTNGADLETHTALYAHPPVTAEPAAAPSVDLVEGLNVEEWADKAEKRGGKIEALNAVLSDAADALVAHGFTKIALESQTLAESIHVLAGRGVPSVEQIAEVLQRHNGEFSDTWIQEVAEDLHDRFGTPGNAGESALGNAYAAEMEANDQAKHRIEELEALANRQAADASSKSATIRRRTEHIAHLRAEVERCKAALEAADTALAAIRGEAGRYVAWRGVCDEVAEAKRVYERQREYAIQCTDAYAAARAAVEADTSEEAGA